MTRQSHCLLRPAISQLDAELLRGDESVDQSPETPATTREVMAWMWYPATPSKGQMTAEYLPSAWRAALARYQGKFMSSFFKRGPSLVRTRSFSNAPVSPEPSQYPVALLRAGGSALTADFTTLAEDLASHGYFVIGFDALHRSFVVVLPDGRVSGPNPIGVHSTAKQALRDIRQIWTRVC